MDHKWTMYKLGWYIALICDATIVNIQYYNTLHTTQHTGREAGGMRGHHKQKNIYFIYTTLHYKRYIFINNI